LIGDSAIEVANFSFDPGCSLLVYTDGLIEADRDIVAGFAALRSAFSSEPPARGAVARIYERALGRASSDDVAMLLVSSEATGELRRWRFDPFWRDAVERVRREFLDAITSTGLHPARFLDVEIVFAEVLSNLLRYVAGLVDIFLECNPDNHVMHVLDPGPGFQFNPRLPSDPMSESGRGLFLISALSTQFSVERRPGGGSHARIVFAREKERLTNHDGR
jgi:anti-sigma regulatory factor (Ser/Thr protein kinase)